MEQRPVQLFAVAVGPGRGRVESGADLIFDTAEIEFDTGAPGVFTLS